MNGNDNETTSAPTNTPPAETTTPPLPEMHPAVQVLADLAPILFELGEAIEGAIVRTHDRERADLREDRAYMLEVARDEKIAEPIKLRLLDAVGFAQGHVYSAGRDGPGSPPPADFRWA